MLWQSYLLCKVAHFEHVVDRDWDEWSHYFSSPPPGLDVQPVTHYIWLATLRAELAPGNLSILMSVCERTRLDIYVQPTETSTDVCSLSLFTCFMTSSCHCLAQNLEKTPFWMGKVQTQVWTKGLDLFIDRLWLNSTTCLNHRCGEEQGATTWPRLPFERNGLNHPVL